MGEGVLSEPTNEKTADDIDNQRSIGKLGACMFLHQSLQGVTRERASCSEYYQQCNPHCCTFPCATSCAFGVSLSDRDEGPLKQKTPGAEGGQESSARCRAVEANSIAYKFSAQIVPYKETFALVCVGACSGLAGSAWERRSFLTLSLRPVIEDTWPNLF